MFNPFARVIKTPQRVESIIIIDPKTPMSRALIFSLEGGLELLGDGRGDLDTAVSEASRKAGFKPKRAVVGIGGQNAWCLTTTLRYNRKEGGSPISKRELQKVSQMLNQTAKMQTEQQLAEYLGELEEEFVLIDSDQPQFTIDSQPVLDPLQKTGKVLKASFFTAYSPDHYISKIKTRCQNLELDLFALFSVMNTLIEELANDERHHFNAVVVRSLDTETEVAVCFGGRIFGNRIFSLGTSDPTNLWVEGLETALSDFAGVKKFPDRLVLVGADAKMAKLKEVLENYPLIRSLAFAERPFIEIRGDVETQALTHVGREILEGSNGD